MSTRKLCGLLVALLLSAGTIQAQVPGEPDPLFASDDVLNVRIVAPIKTLMGDRPDMEELPGTLSWTSEAGEVVTVGVALRTRGNYRRQRTICPFAPLRLNLKKSEVKDTLFDKQDKLKLVTHCRDGITRYEQSLLREHLVYKMFNELTDYSFRVRLLRITYVDSDSDNRERTEYGFVIEHQDRLAKRTALPVVDLPRAPLSSLESAYTNLVLLFEYFVGNTDFSPVAGPKDEACCHNATLFGRQETGLYPIPYDFDMSGMVNADYATPNPRFNLPDVRTRLYRGRCHFNDHIPASIARFNEKKDRLYELVETDENLNGRTRREMRRFMNEFFDVLDKPKSVSRHISGKCT